MTQEQRTIVHFLREVVRSDVVNQRERTFCASVLRQVDRHNRPPTPKQMAWASRLVARWKEQYLRSGDVTEQ